MTITITIVGVSLLIIFHELGHYLVARAFGMRVHRFSIGFGPAILSGKRGDTVWQLAAIPLGGYVQIQGMGPAENEPSDGHGFRDKPRWQRALVLAAGPVANWAIAATCLVVLAASVGLRDYSRPSAELGTVEEGSPAALAGMLPGDRIVSIGGVAVSDWDALVAQIQKHPARAVPVVLERDGEQRELRATPAATESGHGRLGVTPAGTLVRYDGPSALAAGIRESFALTALQAELLWGVVTRQREGRLSGLPGIVKMLSAQARQSFARFFETLATLSIVLFILNLAPIPALDGSRLLFLGVEAARRRPTSELVETWVHSIGLVVLLGLMLFVSLRDLM